MEKKTAQTVAELKQWLPDQLAAELATLSAKMVELRFEKANRALKDTTQLRKTRRQIARILTLQQRKNQ